MTTIRIFAFIAAVLITAALFRVIADGLTDEQAIPTTSAASFVATEAGSTDRPQAARD
jgi:hypothetical protein